MVTKKYYLVMLLFSLFSCSLFAQQVIEYNKSNVNGFNLVNQKSNSVVVNFSINKLFLEDVNVDGINLKTAKIQGVFLPNETGMPDLAGTGRYIAIPHGATVTYKILSYKTDIIQNIDIAPAPQIPLDNDPSPLKYPRNKEVFSKDAYYPESPVKISEPDKVRGLDVVMLGITPFQYNPVKKELIVYSDIKVEVSFIGGNGKFGDDAYRNRWWESILSDNILNYSSLPKIDFDRRYTDLMLENGYEYVIIIPNNPEFSAWADTIKNFRLAQGIKTGIFKLSEIGGNSVEAIKNWVTNAYNTWTIKPVAVCLLGDYGTETTGAASIISKLQTHPESYPAFASDNYYADVDGNEIPDIVFSRIIANDTTQLQTLIKKEINYERNPPTSATYYDHPITALGWQTERWFQLCSELVGGYFKKIKNKHPVRINKVYSGTPGTVWSTATNTATVVSYFGTEGLGYIPMTPDSLGGFSGGTAGQIIGALNSGAFILQHRDHGSYTGWGEPSFTTTNIGACNNPNLLTFVFSINCETGAYHNPTGCPANGSFVEIFYRFKYNNQNAGALGMVCPSETSYSFVNDAYTWGMYDNMWPDFMPEFTPVPAPRGEKPAFGMTAGKYFLQQSSWPYNTGNKVVTYRLFHMHGDAFLNLYSEVPQNLTVNHANKISDSATSFTVTANNESFIALSFNGQILGTATGTGSAVNIPVSGTLTTGQKMKVVVTKQNYFRYEADVTIGTVGINTIGTSVPNEYTLSQNYPNPFNPVTKINFALPKNGMVTLKVYDILSREVITLVNENKPAGYYSVDFDASKLTSGVYFYKLESGSFSDIKRMILVK
jgi:hypothetical protein